MNGIMPTNIKTNDVVMDSNELWITHYVDYTKKYGMGYLLCNGNIGIYFNDATKVKNF